MNQNLKISFLILIALGISFSVFVIVIQYFYENQINSEYYDEEKYYNSIREIDNKIFLVGGSQISALNPFIIEAFLTENNENYQVFNLSKMANVPQREIRNIDLLISAEPEIVVYGISARDFSEIKSVNKPEVKLDQSLPDPSLLFKNWLNDQNTEILLLQPDFSPKLIILKELRGVTVNSQDYIKAPFFRFDYKRDFNVMNNNGLKSLAINDATPVKIRDPDENRALLDLKEIINKLQENNIKIILFTTPQHKYIYDLVDSSEKITFEKILTDITKHTDLEIHLFTEKYSDLDIWRNPTHIVVGKDSLIFSEDIANLILEELR